MNIASWLLLFILGAVCASEAVAQDWEILRDGDHVGLRVPRGAALPTVDELQARLLEMQGGPRIARGVVHEGGELLAWRQPHSRVGRLQNDVYRSGPLGARVLALPAGTPMYHATYRYAIGTTDEPDHIERNWPMWCGAAPNAAGEIEGHCIISRLHRTEIARIRSASPHYPVDLAEFVPSTEPIIEIDASAAEELPAWEGFYLLERVANGFIELQSGIRIEGRSAIIDRARLPRRGGVAELRGTGYHTRFLPAEEGGVRVEMIEPDLTQFRIVAEQMIAEAAAAQAEPPATTP